MAARVETDGRWFARRRRTAVWGTALAVLLLPLVAMQFTGEVAWDAADFAVLGVMLLAACGAFELAATTTRNKAYRTAVAIAVVTALLLIWMNLAVGIIGSEDDPANLMFGGVLAVGVIGVFTARFRPAGMARALAATALAQALAGALAIFAGWGDTAADGSQVISALTAFFAALWLGSAWLFRKGARERSSGKAA